jgi:hypothetical protein
VVFGFVCVVAVMFVVGPVSAWWWPLVGVYGVGAIVIRASIMMQR